MATNLATVTRDLIDRTVHEQVYRRMAFFDELKSREQIVTGGGKTIGGLADYAEMDDLAQAYDTNDTLTDSEKTFMDQPSWLWKKIQMPIRYDADVEIQNSNAGREEQLVDLAAYLAKKAMRGIRLKLEQMAANFTAQATATTTTALFNDTGKNFQSIIHALKHVTTAENYGNLSRGITLGKRNWWQGADAATLMQYVAEGTAPTASVQSTATYMNIGNLRTWWKQVQFSINAKEDLMTIMCPTLFNKLKAECQAQMIYQNATDTAKVGFNKMFIDGHPIADWDLLETHATSKLWVFILNLTTWKLHLNKARNFKMTPFKWAGELPNGKDYYLARILLAGNLCCYQPNSNLFLSNVS